MFTDRKPDFRPPDVRCVVCETYSRPWDAPWPQHAVGCTVRQAQLGATPNRSSAPVPAPGARLAAA